MAECAAYIYMYMYTTVEEETWDVSGVVYVEGCVWSRCGSLAGCAYVHVYINMCTNEMDIGNWKLMHIHYTCMYTLYMYIATSAAKV